MSASELLSGFKNPYEHGLSCANAIRAGSREDPLVDRFVPVDHVVSEKLRWLEGLVDGAGCMSTLEPTSIRVTSANETFLRDVKRMLNAMGADPRVCELNDTHFIPYHILLIDANDQTKLHTMGFSPKLGHSADLHGHLESFVTLGELRNSRNSTLQ